MQADLFIAAAACLWRRHDERLIFGCLFRRELFVMAVFISLTTPPTLSSVRVHLLSVSSNFDHHLYLQNLCSHEVPSHDPPADSDISAKPFFGWWTFGAVMPETRPHVSGSEPKT